jgi:cytosine/adenosine deaminase-related metal-dependent hydrolase
MASTEHTIRARWVIPIAAPPIENGYVVVANGKIVRTGKIPGQSSRGNSLTTHDLGDVAILPGLVNAHTHLEFSDLQQPIGRPGMELAEWIGEVIGSRSETAGRAQTNPGAAQTVITSGAMEARDSGTVLIGEIATTPWPGLLKSTNQPPTIIAFAEVLGLSPERAAERLRAAENHIALQPTTRGISPHAPYSTPPALIDQCVKLALRSNCPLAMHVAESPAERMLLSNGSGPFADSLTSLGLDTAKTFPWRQPEPMSWLIDRLAEAPTAMLIHGNDLRPDEITRIAAHPSLSVVFCPRTHAFFGHARHPVAELLDAGINVALGTDSRASNPDLQLWREARFLLNHRQDLAPNNVLKMATLGGAIALHRSDSHGTLLPGRTAAFAAVPATASGLKSLYSELAESDASSIDALHN